MKSFLQPVVSLLAAGGVTAALLVASATDARAGEPPAVTASDNAAARACWGQPERGSAGHHGNSSWCDAGRYRQVIRCETLGGYQYTHYGPWVWAPAKSTAWCNLGDRVVNTWVGV
ncbi:hypothetical protein [Streptomyces candidus]|uniref:Secreted protein n=1 Tax=Streptomyces candidus TaxID=67283 RepID=A0A7X0HLX2_9ACTN|nr:hypothetical protein [Streptomyces candidus]MBB6439878.1 hypothetical protein [Streptomyces candidus]GHH55815.1 hypothetical protein GCM10018773_60750 [Streptomyces candidus]